jgi:CRP/FNR family transcriptional regulator, cyclic AMP receptor protein
MRETPDLRDVPIFKHLDEDERAEFEELSEPMSFEAGETILEEGAPEGRLYVLTSGTVEVYKKILPGRRQRLATIEAPTVIGEMGLLTEPRAAASVEAITRVEAHGLGRDRLLEMLDADSPAACKLVYEIGRTLAERIAATNETVAEVISRLENTAARGSEDIDVFRDQLVQDWGF